MRFLWAYAGGDDALAEYIADNSLLAGAVVRFVIDVGIRAGDLGDDAGEKENMPFAERVSRLYNEQTGSNAHVDLVTTYRNMRHTGRPG